MPAIGSPAILPWIGPPNDSPILLLRPAYLVLGRPGSAAAYIHVAWGRWVKFFAVLGGLSDGNVFIPTACHMIRAMGRSPPMPKEVPRVGTKVASGVVSGIAPRLVSGGSPLGSGPHSTQEEPLRELLAGLGYGGNNEGVARKALEEARLTRPGRQAIASSKREQVVECLLSRFVLVCQRASCQKELVEAGPGPGPGDDQRTRLVPERHGDCSFCGGSDNKKAVERLCATLLSRGKRRLVVVGGSPAARQALEGLVGNRLQLRLVDGVARRTRVESRADLLWADLVVVWGGTQLDHKVSTLYTDFNEGKVVAVHRRGIAALVDELLDNAR